MATTNREGPGFKPFRTMYRWPYEQGYLTHSASDTEEEAWRSPVPKGAADKIVVRLTVCEPPKVWVKNTLYRHVDASPGGDWLCVWVFQGPAKGDALLVQERLSDSLSLRLSQNKRANWKESINND